MHSTFVDSTTWTLFIHWLWDHFIFEAWTWSTYFVTNIFYIKLHPRLSSFKHLYTQKYLFLNIYLFDVEHEFASMLNNYNLYCIRNNSVWKSLREFSDLHLRRMISFWRDRWISSTRFHSHSRSSIVLYTSIWICIWGGRAWANSFRHQCDAKDALYLINFRCLQMFCQRNSLSASSPYYSPSQEDLPV